MIKDLKEFEKIHRNNFKNHILTTLEDTDNVKVYVFQEEGKFSYKLNIVCFQNYISITGDLGDWIFDCTWQTSIKSISTDNMSYFLGKLSNKCKKHIWDYQRLQTDLDEMLKEWVKDIRDRDLSNSNKTSIIKDLKEIFKELSQCNDEWEYITKANELTIDLERLGFQDIWESGLYSCGQEIDMQLRCVLIGLAMAKEQALKENKKDAKN